MQQAHELRIGNLVRNVEGTICPVTQLVLNELGLNVSIRCSPTSKKFGGMEEVISPIEVTYEILEAIGFKVHQVSNTSQKVYVKDGFVLNSRIQLCSYDGSMTLNDRRLEFIHQLQNQYLLITGVELVIDPTAIK